MSFFSVVFLLTYYGRMEFAQLRRKIRLDKWTAVSMLFHSLFRILSNENPMKFIEMTGEQLAEIINDGELHISDLQSTGVTNTSIVRVNEHGDIEVRRTDKWDVIGGLLASFEDRIRQETGFDWA